MPATDNLERFRDLDTAYQGMVYPRDTDHMGHANVRFYTEAFNEASYYTFTTAGVTPDFIAGTNQGMAAVEEHYYYRRELRPGDLVIVKTCFIGFTAKVLHVWCVMLDAIRGDVCAVSDHKCVHFDTVARKSVRFPAEIFERGVALVRERPEI